MEIPDLCLSSIWNLDDHVSVIDQIKVSVLSHIRNDVEVSFNIKTELFIELTLYWFLWILINIDDIPLLVDMVVLIPDNDVSVLFIFVSVNVHDLSLFINEVVVLISKDIPPS